MFFDIVFTAGIGVAFTYIVICRLAKDNEDETLQLHDDRNSR